MTVLPVVLFEDLGPGFLRVIEHKADQLYVAIFASEAFGGWSGSWPVCLNAALAASGKKCAKKVSARDKTDDEQNNEAYNPQPTSAETATARPAAVFDILTHSTWRPVHTS